MSPKASTLAAVGGILATLESALSDVLASDSKAHEKAQAVARICTAAGLIVRGGRRDGVVPAALAETVFSTGFEGNVSVDPIAREKLKASVVSFANTHCVPRTRLAKDVFEYLYNAYFNWSESEESEQATQPQFRTLLCELGYEKYQVPIPRSGNLLGLRLHDESKKKWLAT